MQTITRRAALAAAPLAFAGAATAQAAKSPARRLWHEHKAATDAYNAHPAPDGDPETEALHDHILMLERKVARLRPQSLEDLAWLVLFADDDGAIRRCVGCADPLLAFCRSVVGIQGA